MFWNLWMHEGVCEWVSVHTERCVRRITSSLKVWFSACAAASSLSLSLSLSCVFSQVLRKLFTSSLLSTLLWQFSRRDFCKGDFFYLSSQPFFYKTCTMTAAIKGSVTLICYLQADVSGYKGAVHLIKALHGWRPDPHLWLQTPPMWIGSLQTHMVHCIFRFIHSFTDWSLMRSVT